ncbi:MAG: CAP domain-containing protein [Leptolyngbyaceae cyanobacterium]
MSFNIEFDYRFAPTDAITENVKSRLEQAAQIWESLIVDEFPNVPAGETFDVDFSGLASGGPVTLEQEIDDLVIFVSASPTLGAGIGGYGGTFTTDSTFQRFNNDNFEPAVGIVVFNSSADLVADFGTALHEIGHALGFSVPDVFKAAQFSGDNTLALTQGQPVPLTANGHVHGDFLFQGVNALMGPGGNSSSVPTMVDLAILADIGYEIPALADPYKPLGFTLVGTSDNEYIEGGNGDDRLNGGSGEDNLLGGGGRDTYVIGTDAETVSIWGFEPNHDVIQLAPEWGLSPQAAVDALDVLTNVTSSHSSVPESMTVVSTLDLGAGRTVTIYHNGTITANNFEDLSDASTGGGNPSDPIGVPNRGPDAGTDSGTDSGNRNESVSISAFGEQVVQLTNEFRAEYGLQPLAFNLDLIESAQGHSDDMASQDFFSHTGLDGSSPGDRALEAGYPSSYVWENIGTGYTTPEEAVQGWINSPGHRDNMLNSEINVIGVGYTYLENDTGSVNYNHYWTQVFGQSSDSYTPPNLDPLDDGSGNQSGDRQQMKGSTQNDKMNGSVTADLMLGGRGNDKLDGKDGDDLLKGQHGNDKLKGGNGADTLLGGGGSDRLVGQSGDDWLKGGTGDDKLKGGDGDDHLYAQGKGGNGDLLMGQQGADIYYLSPKAFCTIRGFSFESGDRLNLPCGVDEVRPSQVGNHVEVFGDNQLLAVVENSNSDAVLNGLGFC